MSHARFCVRKHELDSYWEYMKLKPHTITFPGVQLAVLPSRVPACDRVVVLRRPCNSEMANAFASWLTHSTLVRSWDEYTRSIINNKVKGVAMARRTS
jgi:hypothetical protein